MAITILGLGSNIGDRENYLRSVLAVIGKSESCKVLSLSSIYETDAWGREDQAIFLNQLVKLETTFDPLKLLDFCQEIEKNLGRTRDDHWGARTIDIDILLYDGIVFQDERLQIPHPLLTKRKFVLIPLAEIASSFLIPGVMKNVEQALEECKDKRAVRIFKEIK